MKRTYDFNDNLAIFNDFQHIMSQTNPKVSESLTSLRKLIEQENWEDAWKNETWSLCLKNAILTDAEISFIDAKPFEESLRDLKERFPEEVAKAYQGILKILIIDERPQMQPRINEILRKHYLVDGAISVSAVKNVSELKENGLDYYDLILLEVAMSPSPTFTLSETFDGLETGWSLYNKYMRSLKKALVTVWTYPIEDFVYPSLRHPDRNWGKNVLLLKKRVGDDTYIMDFIEKYLIKKEFSVPDVDESQVDGTSCCLQSIVN